MEKITLKNIAGYKEEKVQARKIIDCLKNYERYSKDGISLPKGLLITGPSGVGKTLFSTAIANEAGVKFIKFENKDNNPISNIKKYFKEARENKPSVLYIDELETLIPSDKSIINSDEQNKVLQLLLTEIDGFNTSEGVLVIGSTINLRKVPEALRRSGRLEQSIRLENPDLNTRIEILDYYMSKQDSLKNISREKIAKKCNSFNGSTIKQLVNEVLIDCKYNKKEPTLALFESYIPQLMYRDLKKANTASELEFTIPHEIGHFICNYVLNNDVASISVAKYADAVGRTTIDDKEENKRITRNTLMNEIVILLGGIAAENVIVGDCTSGACGDVSKALHLIHSMMDSGMLGFDLLTFKYGDQFDGQILLSEKKLGRIEQVESKYFNEAYEKACNIIKDNMYIYDLLKDKLREVDNLSSDDIFKILEDYNNTHTN